MEAKTEHTTKESILLSTAYLPNIQYFSKLFSGRKVLIEVWDSYQKQSFRNRTTIHGANGSHDLVIPVKRPQGNSSLTRDVLLDYDMPWNKTHWKAICSAYRHSPFFDIFEAELAPAYEKKLRFLLDWNFMLIELIGRMTGTALNYKETVSYQSADEVFQDYRDVIHPKPQKQTEDKHFMPIPYFQVFRHKHGFIENLSFVDLLFHEGPQAVYLCKKCTR
ncbi:MAG: WbqC family protein [Bacteroidales bacterium]|nr:WbqC family protein [Bacteroidales bacterium]